MRFGVHDLLDDGEEVERAAREPVNPRHRHHVAGGQHAEHPIELAPVGPCTGHLLPVDVAAAASGGGAKLVKLAVEGLRVGARDIWDPFGMRDRSFMVLFGGMCAALYVMFAFAPVSYQSLLVANLLLGSAFLFVSSAQNGLTSALGQQHVMSGQVSAAWNIFGSLPGIAALLLGGFVSDLMERQNATRATHMLFLVGAVIMALAALYGLWKPASVFGNLKAERASDAHPVDDIKRLVRHWPIYPALLIWFLWNFAPGSGTPLQYYLQDALHAEDSQWGQWNAIFSASFIPTFLIYGVLCRKFPLRPLLFCGTVVAVPQFVPLLFIHSVTGALIAAAPIGLMGGIATAAYMDLMIRSCPRGLQGTLLMMSAAL